MDMSVANTRASDRLDLARSAATLFFAAAQPIAGRLSQITGTGVAIEQRSQATKGPTTPANGAFVIWGPLFLAGLGFAIREAAREKRHDPLVRQVGWLTGAAFAGNTAWSIQAQYRGLGWESVGIIASSAGAAITGLIESEQNARHSDEAKVAANTIAPLAGWLTVASFANIEATLNHQGYRLEGEAEQRRAVTLVAAASAVGASVSLASRGNPLYAATAGWGLGGIALRNFREDRRPVAMAAGLGIAALAATTIAGLMLRGKAPA